MPTSLDTLDTLLNQTLQEYKLDCHPFVIRFASGKFSKEAIRWWAMKMLPGSNRFNQAFLKVASCIADYRHRVVMLQNIYTEHGELDPDKAHVALFIRFMQGIGCPNIDVNEYDGAYTVPELRFKRFDIPDDEPLLRSLGRFAAIEVALPSIFTQYIQGLHKVFPEVSDQTIEYFYVHCELDPTHTAELLDVANAYVKSELDIQTFNDGVKDMFSSISDMFSWMSNHMDQDIDYALVKS
jgi:pyrroloquinoline-quinone synthase